MSFSSRKKKYLFDVYCRDLIRCKAEGPKSTENNMFGEVCNNFTYNFHWNNETFTFDHELECTVSRTVFVLFSFIGIAGLFGNSLVVLGESRHYIDNPFRY